MLEEELTYRKYLATFDPDAVRQRSLELYQCLFENYEDLDEVKNRRPIIELRIKQFTEQLNSSS